MTINKQAVFTSQDLKTETVELPEWGGTLCVRTMTGTERDAWEASLSPVDGNGPNLANLRARLLVKCVVDDQGERVFADADADALGAKSAAVLERLFAVAQRLNGLAGSSVAAASKN
jgi:hypothetical protein